MFASATKAVCGLCKLLLYEDKYWFTKLFRELQLQNGPRHIRPLRQSSDTVADDSYNGVACRERIIDKRKMQFWYLSRYNKELRDWLAEHPDKLGRDFFEYAEELKHQYWNTGIDEIRRLKREREGGIFEEEVGEQIRKVKEAAGGPSILGADILPVAPAEPKEAELPRPKTKAEYDALPSGTEYIHPDGTRRVKK